MSEGRGLRTHWAYCHGGRPPSSAARVRPYVHAPLADRPSRGRCGCRVAHVESVSSGMEFSMVGIRVGTCSGYADFHASTWIVARRSASPACPPASRTNMRTTFVDRDLRRHPHRLPAMERRGRVPNGSSGRATLECTLHQHRDRVLAVTPAEALPVRFGHLFSCRIRGVAVRFGEEPPPMPARNHVVVVQRFSRFSTQE